MQCPDSAKNYYNRGRNLKAPLPNVQAILKQVKENPRYEHYLRKNNSQSRPYTQKPSSSMSNRSDSLGSYNTTERAYSIENSVNDIVTTNDSSNSSKDSPNSFNTINKLPKKLAKPSQVEKVDRKAPLLTESEDSSILKEITSFERFVIDNGIHPPVISAKCWAVMDARSGELLYAKRETKRREIASLTKMMTVLCVCKLIKKFNVDPKDTYIQVSKLASTMIGTSAKLKYGDVLSIWDLMHGLMLPSGNDAAYTLAESFGTYIYLQSDEYKFKVRENPEYANVKVKNPVKYFLDLMNQIAGEFDMSNTFYANPHGLINQHSHSTAADQAKLTFQCLKYDMIKEVCSKKFYTCEIEQFDQSTRIATWENTNKLLGKEGWRGLKTGVTTAAGPCFSGYYEKGEDSYIVVLLCSSSMDIRWVEAPRLVNWMIESRRKFRYYS
jgi:D-alanyl-D-alanine carboxypeptidase